MQDEAKFAAEGTSEAPVVLSELNQGVLLVTLNRPERLNASTPEMVHLYMSTLLAAAEDDAVKVIVVTGAGRGFCAGADTGQLGALAAGGARAEKLRRHWFTTQIPKPVIAAINGPCVGVGFAIAMMCDMRIAARSARVGAGFARLGLPAENGMAWVLPRVAGYARAFEILASGRLYAGDELDRMGIVNQIVADEALMAHVLALAGDMARNCSPRSMAMMKTQLQQSPYSDLPEADRLANKLISESVAAPDFREAMQSRKDKRPAVFAALGTQWWPEDEKR